MYKAGEPWARERELIALLRMWWTKTDRGSPREFGPVFARDGLQNYAKCREGWISMIRRSEPEVRWEKVAEKLPEGREKVSFHGDEGTP